MDRKTPHRYACGVLPTHWKLAWVVRADAVMVAVVRMADGGAAVV